MEQQKGFLASLFDASFSQFIATRLIKVLFILGIIVSVVYAVAFIASGFGKSLAFGVVLLILSPLLFLLMVIAARVYLELILVMFRIEENTRGLRNQAQPVENP